MRANRELGADFDLRRWRHCANYNSINSRIEMYLISEADQKIRIEDRQFDFRADERILTEYSYKHTRESFAALAGKAGFDFQKMWTDQAALVGVFYFTCSRGR